MPIDKNDVSRIARLARLNLKDEELDYFAGQLRRIIGYIDQLAEVDTTDTKPVNHAFPIQNVFRRDSIKPSLKREDALKNAPAQEDGLFKVPRIIEEL